MIVTKKRAKGVVHQVYVYNPLSGAKDYITPAHGPGRSSCLPALRPIA